MEEYRTLREKAWNANQALVEHGLVALTFGNASVIDRARGVFAIKPSGVPYERLRPDDLVIVDLEGQVVDGALSPSSDTRTHAVLYRSFKAIGAVVHTHSTYAVAWAQAGRAIPVYGTTHADHAAVPVPCTPAMSAERIAGDYELETGLQIVDHLAECSLSPVDVQMVLVGGHGPFTWGKEGAQAVHNSVMLEEIAKMAALTEMLNPSAGPLHESLIAKHHERKHGRDAYYGQS